MLYDAQYVVHWQIQIFDQATRDGAMRRQTLPRLKAATTDDTQLIALKRRILSFVLPAWVTRTICVHTGPNRIAALESKVCTPFVEVVCALTCGRIEDRILTVPLKEKKWHLRGTTYRTAMFSLIRLKALESILEGDVHPLSSPRRDRTEMHYMHPISDTSASKETASTNLP